MLKAQLIGNIGGDPEMRFTANGDGRLQFNVASNHRVKNASGNWDDATEWVRVTVFGKRAESLAGILVKGMKVYVDGKLEARPWISNDGNPKAGLEMVASDVEFMSARQDGQGQQREPAAAGSVAPAGATRPAEDRGDLDSLPF